MKKLLSLLLLIVFLMVSCISAFASDGSSGQTYGILHGETEVPLYSEPNTSARIQGYYLPGTKAEVLQYFDEWYEIYCGEYALGFVKSDALEIWECEPIPFVGMPVDGFVVVSAGNDMLNQEAPRYVFPNVSSQQLDSETVYTGQTLSLLSVLGDWCQVRTVNDTSIAFVESKYVDIYLIDELFTGSQVETADFGAYKVGANISEGLYRIETAATGETSVSISNPNSEDAAITIMPDSIYTIYLPEASEITLSGDGLFSSVGNQSILQNDGEKVFSGNGRFLMGVELPYSDQGYILRNADASQPAYYRLTSINYTYYDNEEPTFIEIPPNSSTQLPFEWGVFVEVQNCTIETSEVNG